MLEQRFRHHYQKIFIAPILQIGCKFSPTAITVLSGVVGLLVIPAVYFHYPWLAISILAFSGYLDTLDGSVARACDSSSQLGGALDIVMDRVVESAVIFALYLVDPSRGIACFLMLFANLICITSFLVVGIFVEQNSNKSFFYHNGLIERAEAFIFYALMIVLPGLFTPLAYGYIALVLLSAFLHLRFFHFWQKDNT